MKLMTVFVTDGTQRSTLAVVRSLGRAGVKVVVGSDAARSLAGSSKYCVRTVRYPSPQTSSAQFQDFVQREMWEGKYRLLIPMTDITTRLVAQIYGPLPASVRVATPGEHRLLLAQDKGRVLMLAERASIGFPKTYWTKGEESIEEIARRVRYPAVIKPRFSRFWNGAEWVAGDVEYGYDAEDLIRKYRRSHARVPFPLVQEKIEGEGQGVFLLMWEGKLKAAFAHRRLREKPPWGGPSVLRESIPLAPDLLKKSTRLLEEIGWHGPAMLEFKVDRRDGEAKLMEVNGRFWGSLQLAIDAGMDFPLLLYRLATGEKLTPQFDYKVGVKSRWLLGDLDHLLIRLRNGNNGNSFHGNDGSRLRACVRFLKLYERNCRYEVFRWEDRGPGKLECENYLRSLRDAWRARGQKEKQGAN